jgi:hypothetical protein
MKRLLTFALLLTSASLSFAESSAPDAQAAEARVKSGLLEPLAAKEREQSKFSRARLPAQERRVRVDQTPQIDARGAVFYTFAVDARHGIRRKDDEGWKMATVTGCAYANGDLYVKNGERHRPAAFLLGKNLKPVAEHICAAATVTASKS